MHNRPPTHTWFLVFIVMIVIGMIWMPEYSPSANVEQIRVTQTASRTATLTRTASLTPTITSTPTITPTPTVRPGTHVPKADVAVDIQLDQDNAGPLAFSTKGLLAVGFNGGIKVYDTKNYALKKSIQLSYQVDQLEFSPNGKYLAASMHYTGNSDQQPFITSIWETTKWNLQGSVTDGKGALNTLAWDQDSRIILVGRDAIDKNNHALFLWYANGAAVSALESPPISSLMVTDDNQQIVVGGKDGSIYVYDFKSGEILKRIQTRASAITGIGMYKPNWISATNAAGELYVWNDQDQSIYTGDLAVSSGFGVSPDRRAVAFCSRYGYLIDFDFTSEDSYYQDVTGRCVDTAFNSDGSLLAASFTDGKIRVFSAYTEGKWSATAFPTAVPTATQIFPKITPNVVAAEDKSAIQPSNYQKIQILETGIPVDDLAAKTSIDLPYPFELNGPNGTTWMAFSADGTLKAVPEGNKVNITDLATQKNFLLQADIAKLNTLSFSPAGDFVAGGAVDGGIFVWSVKDREPVCKPFTTPVIIKSVQFNPAGTMLAVGYENELIEVYSIPACDRIAQMPKNTRSINDLAFSPDGIYLSSAAADNLALLFYLPSQKMIRKIEPDHRVKGLYSVAYNPYQTILAVGTYEGYVTLWNVNSAEYLSRYLVGSKSNPVVDVLFTADGKQVIACLKDKTCSILGFDK